MERTSGPRLAGEALSAVVADLMTGEGTTTAAPPAPAAAESPQGARPPPFPRRHGICIASKDGAGLHLIEGLQTSGPPLCRNRPLIAPEFYVLSGFYFTLQLLLSGYL